MPAYQPSTCYSAAQVTHNQQACDTTINPYRQHKRGEKKIKSKTPSKTFFLFFLILVELLGTKWCHFMIKKSNSQNFLIQRGGGKKPIMNSVAFLFSFTFHACDLITYYSDFSTTQLEMTPQSYTVLLNCTITQSSEEVKIRSFFNIFQFLKVIEPFRTLKIGTSQNYETNQGSGIVQNYETSQGSGIVQNYEGIQIQVLFAHS